MLMYECSVLGQRFNKVEKLPSVLHPPPPVFRVLSRHRTLFTKAP